MSKQNNQSQNQKVLQILRSGTQTQQNEIIRKLMEKIKPRLAGHIYNNYSIYRPNLKEKLQDTLQEAYIRLYINIQKPGFVFKNSLEDFFWGICKIYLLEGTREARPANEEPREQGAEDVLNIDPKEPELNIDLFDKLMQEMGGDCQEVLQYKYENILLGKKARSSEEVAAHFGYTSAYVRVKISECRKKLVELKDKKLGIKK